MSLSVLKQRSVYATENVLGERSSEYLHLKAQHSEIQTESSNMDNAFAVMKEKIGFLSGLEHHGKTYDASVRKGWQRPAQGHTGTKIVDVIYLRKERKVLLTQIVTELNSGGKDDQD